MRLANTAFAVYPETAGRTLESIDALFSTKSPFNWNMEKAYREHGDVLAEHNVPHLDMQAKDSKDVESNGHVWTSD